jgi:hypothetical protein
MSETENFPVGGVEDFDFGYSAEEYDKCEIRTTDVITEAKRNVANRIETLSYPDPYDNVETCNMMITALRTISFWSTNDHTVIASITDAQFSYLASAALDGLDSTADVFDTAEIKDLSATTVSLSW